MNYDNISSLDYDDEIDDDHDYWDMDADVGFMTHADSCCAFGQPYGEFTRKTHKDADTRSWKELCFVLTKTKENGRPSLVFTKESEALDELLDVCPYAQRVVQTKSRHGDYQVSCWIVSENHD